MIKTRYKGVEIGLNRNGSFDFFFMNHHYVAKSLKGAVDTLAHLMGLS